jgi:chemotaxis protein methyltransferase CheR
VSGALEKIADLVEREAGIQVKGSRLEALPAALGRAAPGVDAEAILATLADPAQGPALLGRLIDQVAVQETFFMREVDELEAIDWHRLLAAAHGRGASEVSVWVAACASGEEAYSVAMLATEAFGHGRPPVSILATDVSAAALRRAQEASYSERSTRELTEARRERFLVPDGSRSAVGEQLRSLVRLRRHNLVSDPAPPVGEVPFDLILCRNVLIYFGPDTVETVVAGLESALQPAGQLILGASDRLSSSARRRTALAGWEPRPTEASRSRRPPSRPSRASRDRLRAPRGPRARRRQAPEPAAEPSSAAEGDLAAAIAAANRGELTVAIEAATRVLAADPLDVDAHYVLGLSELAAGNPAAAVVSLRRALYFDPSFALAAFQLGRAYDRCGDGRAARRAYAWTLDALRRVDLGTRGVPGETDYGDIAAACSARLAGAE